MGVLPLVLSLGACAVGPDYMKPSLALPAKYSSADRTQSVARPQLPRWWTRLGDPTLNALIEEAILGNLNVATAKAQVREARATYRQAEGT